MVGFQFGGFGIEQDVYKVEITVGNQVEVGQMNTLPMMPEAEFKQLLQQLTQESIFYKFLYSYMRFINMTSYSLEVK